MYYFISLQPSVKGDDQAVLFDQSKITLDIPADGVVLESGWSITPLATSEVRLFVHILVWYYYFVQ